jgi:hypothetical protein
MRFSEADLAEKCQNSVSNGAIFVLINVLQ